MIENPTHMPGDPSVRIAPYPDGLPSYGWRSTDPPHSCAYVTPVVMEELRVLGVRRVLDLGCGNGSLCARMARAGLDVVGVENDAAGAALAAQAHPGLRVHRFGVQDDPEDLMRHERPFEVVVSTEVVEHLYAPHLLPAYARRVLQPGGYLIVTTPYHGYAKNLALSVAGRWDHHHTALWHGGHVKFFSRATLGRLLEQAGFRIVQFRGIGRLPWLWKSMLMIGRLVPGASPTPR